MNFGDILSNHMLIAALLSWMAAQLIKAAIYAIVNRKFDITRLVGDGGMPSGHSATVSALTVCAAIEYGLGSPAFAISFVLASVVMHDATGVRREAGKHAKALNELMELLNSDTPPEEKLKEFVGHTPLQVLLGAVLGAGIAMLFY